MSSSSLYTFTNLCRLPESSSRLPRRPGYCFTRVLNTSPTVAPSIETLAWPSAWTRNTVGSLISTAIPAGYNPTPSVEIPSVRYSAAVELDADLVDPSAADSIRPQDGGVIA